MSLNTARLIFTKCNYLMNYQFSIFGISVTMYKLIAFELCVNIVLWAIVKLFNKE